MLGNALIQRFEDLQASPHLICSQIRTVSNFIKKLLFLYFKQILVISLHSFLLSLLVLRQLSKYFTLTIFASPKFLFWQKKCIIKQLRIHTRSFCKFSYKAYLTYTIYLNSVLSERHSEQLWQRKILRETYISLSQV